MIVFARRLFDGSAWLSDVAVTIEQGTVARVAASQDPLGADLVVDSTVPALVDASVRLRGYRQSATDRPWRPIDAITALLARQGIAGVRDGGNSWEALHYARTLPAAPAIALTGPVLTSAEPAHEVERIIPDSDALERTLAASTAEGATWITLGPGAGADLATRACRSARQHGFSVAATPGDSPPGLLLAEGVDVLHGAARMLHELRPLPYTVGAADLLLAWADVPDGAMERALIPRLLHHACALAPELLALRRHAFLREAVEAPGLEDLVEVIPASAWLLEMRRAGGYLLGRRHLASHGALRDLGRAERSTAERGFERLLTFVAGCVAEGVTVLAASRSPGLAVVPGRALLEEAALLSRVGLTGAALLRCLTSVGAVSSGLTPVGSIRAGAPGRLLTGPASRSATDEAFLGALGPLEFVEPSDGDDRAEAAVSTGMAEGNSRH